MFRNFWIGRLLLALVLIGGLAAMLYGVYQGGLSQGYAAGQAAAGSAGQPGAVPPATAPRYYPYYGWGFRPFFFPFFGPWLCLIPLFFFLLFGGLFRGWGWRGGYHHHHHPGDWEHPHGPTPPWAREDRPERPGTGSESGETASNAG